MKIAFATTDGRTISHNFLRARYYQVVTIENGEEVDRDLRVKLQQRVGDAQQHIPLTGQDASDMGEEMLAIINDCTMVAVGGISRPMREKIMRYNVRLVLTNKDTVDEALQEIIQGLRDNSLES